MDRCVVMTKLPVPAAIAVAIVVVLYLSTEGEHRGSIPYYS